MALFAVSIAGKVFGGLLGLLVVTLVAIALVFALHRWVAFKENPLPLFGAPLVGLTVGLLSFIVCPVAVAIGLIGTRLGIGGGGWDTEPTFDGSEPVNFYPHGDLPFGFRWLETIDKRLPGDFTEHALAEWYDRGERWHKGFGRYLASWYWLGLRNRAMTLSVRLGRPCGDWLKEIEGFQRNPDGIWRYCKRFGAVQVVFGYIVWGRTENGRTAFYAGPAYTIKRS